MPLKHRVLCGKCSVHRHLQVTAVIESLPLRQIFYLSSTRKLVIPALIQVLIGKGHLESPSQSRETSPNLRGTWLVVAVVPPEREQVAVADFLDETELSKTRNQPLPGACAISSIVVSMTYPVPTRRNYSLNATPLNAVTPAALEAATWVKSP